MTVLLLSTTTYILMAISLVILVLILVDQMRTRKKTLRIFDSEEPTLPDPPGPKPWPVIGSLAIMAKHDVPYKAFKGLVKTYNSQVVRMKLGSVTCVVVNGLEHIREVLHTNKSSHFDSRPNFARYHLLFHGNKENSLAFCNWSDIHKMRRDILKPHTFPHTMSTNFLRLDDITCNEVDIFLDQLSSKSGQTFHVKPLLLQTCGNIFTNYFCSKRFDLNHREFTDMIHTFDKIFYEVNMGYAVDFIPSLMPFYFIKMWKMTKWSREIREFVNGHIIESRYNSWSNVIPEKDYVDSLINYVKTDAHPKMSWDMSLFALEDIIGGHSAIGNYLMKVFGFLATRPHIQRTAQHELDKIHIEGNTVGLKYRESLPYTQAIIMEAIRLIASPIVPHVANQDTSIAGYRVEKNTLLFLNNYDLNMSDELWTEPNEFMPERFIQNGRILRPEYYLPFGGGRRSCLGYKMVDRISFTIVASVLKNFTILPVEKEEYKISIGYLAIAENTFKFKFEKR